MRNPLRWLLILLACYPLGCGAFLATCAVADVVTAQESEALLAKIHPGMMPAGVEAVVGWPPEYTVRYGAVGDNEQFSSNWTVRGWRLEVIFVNGRSAQWHTFGPDVGPVCRFLGWAFFWWLRPFVED
jgi:hypothetical protein